MEKRIKRLDNLNCLEQWDISTTLWALQISMLLVLSGMRSMSMPFDISMSSMLGLTEFSR